MRARWALLICKIKVEIRKIDIKNKPIDIVEKTKNKTVPILILRDQKILDESLEIILWALSKQKRIAQNYFSPANQKIILNIINENDTKFKYHLDRFKYASRYDKSNEESHFLEAKKILEKWNEILKTNSTHGHWLIGNKESIADWCIWPFVRQFKIACENKKIINYFEPQIELWLNHFENHKYFGKLMHKYSIWKNSSTEAIFPID